MDCNKFVTIEKREWRYMKKQKRTEVRCFILEVKADREEWND